jgi:hypothetical protein
MLTLTATPLASAGTALTGDATIAGLPSGAPPAAQGPEPRVPTPATWPFPETFPLTSGTGRLYGRTVAKAADDGVARVRVAAGRHTVDFG